MGGRFRGFRRGERRRKRTLVRLVSCAAGRKVCWVSTRRQVSGSQVHLGYRAQLFPGLCFARTKLGKVSLALKNSFWQTGKADTGKNSNLSSAAVHLVDHVCEHDVFVPLSEVILSQRLLPGRISTNAHVIPVKRNPHASFPEFFVARNVRIFFSTR